MVIVLILIIPNITCCCLVCKTELLMTFKQENVIKLNQLQVSFLRKWQRGTKVYPTRHNCAIFLRKF